MKAENEAFFHGCDHFLYRESGALQPMRFSKQETEFYENIGEDQRVRAYCTAGVVLSFRTSLERIALSFELYNFTCQETSITLYEDNEMIEVIMIYDDMDSIDITYYKKKKGEVKIDIYLPNVAGAALLDFQVSDATVVSQKKKILLCLGDFIAQGDGSEISASSYANQLGIRLKMELHNKGIGGYIFDANSLQKTIMPNLIAIAYGTSDFGRFHDAAIVLENAKAYCQKVREYFPKIPIYLITPIWRTDLVEETKCEVFLEITKGLVELAKEYKMKSIIGDDIFPHDPEFFQDKKVHPTSGGYDIVTEEIVKVMKRDIKLLMR